MIDTNKFNEYFAEQLKTAIPMSEDRLLKASIPNPEYHIIGEKSVTAVVMDLSEPYTAGSKIKAQIAPVCCAESLMIQFINDNNLVFKDMVGDHPRFMSEGLFYAEKDESLHKQV
jgi:hypothetical protein